MANIIPLYIHIPFCKKKCDYCDFFSMTKFNSNYIEALVSQLEYFARAFNVQGWKSIYIGGGTPSILPQASLALLCASIKKAAPPAKNCEWTLEMNPGTITEELLETAKRGGVNRLSIGVQCMNDRVLGAIGRNAMVSDIESSVGLLEKYWRNDGGESLSWSGDLIAGLPYQTEKDIRHDINYLSEKGASHISFYSLTVEEGTPLQKNIDRGLIPYDQNRSDTLWLFGRNELEKKGFMQYEVSNFARPGFESRHNGAYWALDDYLGIGAGATGTIYGKGKADGIRWTNTTDIEKYVSYWCGRDKEKERPFPEGQAIIVEAEPSLYDRETIPPETEEFEYLMMNLRTLRGVSEKEYTARFGRDLTARLGTGEGFFYKWKQKGLYAVRRDKDDTYYALTKEGLLFLNKFLEEL